MQIRKKIHLMENDVVISEDSHVANIFNTTFVNTISTLNVKLWKNNSLLNSKDPVERVINKYTNHPNTKKLIQSYLNEEKFFFSHIISEDIRPQLLKSLVIVNYE